MGQKNNGILIPTYTSHFFSKLVYSIHRYLSVRPGRKIAQAGTSVKRKIVLNCLLNIIFYCVLFVSHTSAYLFPQTLNFKIHFSANRQRVMQTTSKVYITILIHIILYTRSLRVTYQLLFVTYFKIMPSFLSSGLMTHYYNAVWSLIHISLHMYV